jgi:hypothetical protein
MGETMVVIRIGRVYKLKWTTNLVIVIAKQLQEFLPWIIQPNHMDYVKWRNINNLCLVNRQWFGLKKVIMTLLFYF